MREIHVHVHHDSPSEIAQSLARIEQKQDALHNLLLEVFEQGEQLMTKADDANAKIDRIFDATNNIAADIRGLKVEAGMTQAEADAVNARLENTAVALEAIAAETPDALPPPRG